MNFRTSLLLLALLLSGGAALNASYTYVFQGTDGSLVEFDRERLLDRYANFVIYRSDLEDCRYQGEDCGGIILAGSRPDVSFGTHDFVAFRAEPAHAGRLPDQALSRSGSAWTLPGSGVNGRLLVYERDPDYLFEYYFKDSTGERTFRYYTDRLIARERKIAGDWIDLCGPALPQGCESGDFLANIYGLDALRFPGLLPYYFPQFALTTLGIHNTDSLSPDSGVLTVRSVRNPFASSGPGGTGSGGSDPGNPGTDPEPVPEPSTWLLSALGVLGIACRHAQIRGARRANQPAR